MGIEEMIKQRESLLKQANALLTTAREDNNRDLTEDEQAKYDEAIAAIDKLDVDIKRAQKLNDLQDKQNGFTTYLQSSAGRPPLDDPDPGSGLSRHDQRDINEFSYLKMMREAMDGKFTGLEREMAQEAVKEARASGRQLEGVGIPQMVLAHSGRGKRHVNANDLSVTGDDGDHGGKLVPTELRSLIDILREALMVREMGAQLIGGLTGNVDFPRANDTADPTEKTETGEADQLDPEFDSISLTPKRLPVYGVVTRQLLLQSSTDVEAWFRNFLAFRIASRMDKGALNGSGSSNQPTGLFQAAGIPSVSIGTDGGAPTREHIVKLEGEIDQNNAHFGNLGYLTTPGVRTALKLTKLDDGSGKFVWEQREEVNGYAARVSTNVPSDLSKGDGTDLHGIAFGNWAGMLIGQWGGLDLLVNPYTLDTVGKIRINLWTFYDVAIEREEMFALVKDADVS